MKIRVKISGMTCKHCEMAIKKALENINGVSVKKVNHKKAIAIVIIDQLNEDLKGKINNTIKETGYTVESIEE